MTVLRMTDAQRQVNLTLNRQFIPLRIVNAVTAPLDRIVDLLRPINIKDGLGANIEEWRLAGSRWCRRDETGGREGRIAGQIRAETTAVFVFRYNPDITPAWRIREGSRTWDILSVREGGRQQWTIVQAAERFGQ